MRRWGRRVYPGSLGSLGCTLMVVGFIRGRWVPWDVPWCSLGLSGVARFTGVRSVGCRVYPVSCFHWGAPWGSSGSSGVAGFIGLRPEVVGFIRVHWVAP